MRIQLRKKNIFELIRFSESVIFFNNLKKSQMADLKEFLRSVKSPKNQNLYDHLSNIFTKILLESPKNAYDFFEDYSFDIKSNGFDFKKSQDLKKPNEKYEEIAEFSVKSRALIDVFFYPFFKKLCIFNLNRK